MVAAAELMLDVREATGHNDGPMVEAMLRLVGQPAGRSWCGAFVYKAMLLADVQLPGAPARYAWTPSWASGHIVYDNRRTRAGDERKQPTRASVAPASVVPGDVFTLWYTSLGRVGHVGIVKQWDAPGSSKYVVTLEGNTGSALQRDGDGVYCKRRLKTQLYRVTRWTRC